MSNSIIFRIARAMGDLAVRAAPARRADWALAMRRELEQVEGPIPALGFALGCLRTMLVWRFCTIEGVAMVGRHCVTLGTATLACLCVYVGADLDQPALFWIAGYYGGACLIASGGRMGLLAAYAAIGLIAAAWSWIALSRSMADPAPYARFHQAIAIEEVAMLLSLTLVALVLKRLAAIRRAAA